MDIYDASVSVKMRLSWRTDTNNATIQQKLYGKKTVDKWKKKFWFLSVLFFFLTVLKAYCKVPLITLFRKNECSINVIT